MSHCYLSRRALDKLAQEDGHYKHWVTELDEELPILMTDTEPGNDEPITLHQQFLQNLATHADNRAMAVKRGNPRKWIFWTYTDYYNEAMNFARAMVAVGVPKRRAINIIGFNSPEWAIGFVGATFADCVPVGIYTTSGVEACQYLACHCEAELVLAQTEIHAKKFMAFWNEAQHIRCIVVWEPGEGFEDMRQGRDNIYTYSEFMALGTQEHQPEVQDRTDRQSPGCCLTLVYTSGTTGPPKGVMLSHDNYIWEARMIGTLADFSRDDERVVSYLPLSHAAGQIGDIFGPLYSRCCVYFADETALSGSLVETLTDVRPTFFVGVPRVFEKIQEKMQTIAAGKSSFLRSISAWAKGHGYNASIAQANNESTSFMFWLANALILKNVKKAVGVDQVKAFFTGAAPMQKSTLDYFLSLNWIVMNMYGMSETGGPTSGSSFLKSNLTSAGYALPGTSLVILGPNREVMPAGERGEICFRGRNKFMGYYRNEEMTKETIDKDGWIHSGDEGYLEADGALKITGRFKELIITAGGENIPPILIENDIKERCQLLSQMVLIGDNRKFLSALVTIKNEMAAGALPTNKLTPDAERLIASIGSDATDVPSAAACPKVHEYINSCIEDYNKAAASRAQSVRKFTIIPNDFSIQGGEMTHTMKLRRRIIIDKYAKEIDAMYEEAKL